jgi:hypothetical protein
MPQPTLKTHTLSKLKYEDLPLVYNDVSLAYSIDIHTYKIWKYILNRKPSYRTFYIAKSKGGKRRIDAPCGGLATIQHRILHKYLYAIPTGEHVGAYVPGRSCGDVAARHVNHRLIVKVDIKDFFPSVKKGMVRKVFKNLGYNETVSSLLASLLTYENRLPQGSPTSGAMANIVAQERFDPGILNYADKHGWVYSRYADDLIFSTKKDTDVSDALKLIDAVTRVLNSSGFKVNFAKTRIIPHYKSQKVLGLIVNSHNNIPAYEYRKTRAIIHNCAHKNIDAQISRSGFKNWEDMYAHLHGKISYYRQYIPEKADMLLMQLEEANKKRGGINGKHLQIRNSAFN